MKHEYRRASTAWLGAAALMLGLCFSSSARADDRVRQADERLQPILRQLDTAARDAREQAVEASRRGGDRDLADHMNDFAKKVSALRERVEDHHTSDARLRHDLRDLDDRSRKIQNELIEDRRVDPMVSDRWTRVARLVDDLNSEYRVAMGLQPGPRATSGDWRDQPPASDRDRDRDFDRDRDRGMRQGQAALNGDLRNLARDVSDRVNRLAQRSDDENLSPSVYRFRDDARSFDARLRDNPSLTASDLRDQVSRLYQEAQEARADLDRRDTPDAVRSEWDGILGDVQRMQDMTGGGTAGTSGEDYGYPVDRGPVNDRYGTTAPGYSQLAADLDQRTDQASALAAQLNIGDASEKVSHFAQHASAFTRDLAKTSPEDRQERAKSLLDEARDVQRSLTKHNATPELMDTWNAVIDDLSQLAGTGRWMGGR